jgi:hypothetical protein
MIRGQQPTVSFTAFRVGTVWRTLLKILPRGINAAPLSPEVEQMPPGVTPILRFDRGQFL